MQPPKCAEFLAALKKLKPTASRNAGENNVLLEVDGAVVGRVTVPQGRKPMKIGTFHSACSQAGITKRQGKELVQCTFGREEFEAHWREKLAAEEGAGGAADEATDGIAKADDEEGGQR